MNNLPSELSQITYFGQNPISLSEKTILIRDLFNQVAPYYNYMNDVLSFGMQRLWKKKFIEFVPNAPSLNILDLAGGTGDITFELIKKHKKGLRLSSNFTIYDLSPDMIKKGKDRAIDTNILYPITWICGDAKNLPFKDASFDVCTVSFGLRNMSDPIKVLKEVFRVLKPNGVLLCLEFSHVQSSLEFLYNLYSFHAIPQLGKWLVGNQKAYEYLVESIKNFPTQIQLLDTMKKVGFRENIYQNLSQGIAAIHRGWK